MLNEQTPKVLTLNVPSERATKRLAIKQNGDGRRKIVVSSNWLEIFGFEAGSHNFERSLGPGKGIVIERVRDLFNPPEGRIKKTYSRRYNRRSNRPLETLLEVSSQKLIRESIPDDTQYVHVIFSQDKVEIRPVTTHQQKAMEQADKADPYSVMGACTSGIDLHAYQSEGMTVSSVLEWRPPEARDKTDLSETGCLTALANIKGVKNLFNENIMSLDMNYLAQAMESSPFTTLSISLGCDDHSPAKAKKLKERSQKDLTTNADLVFDFLNLCQTLNPPVVCLENVEGFFNSPLYTDLISVRMRRWGYQEHLDISESRSRGGATPRKRGFAVFSCLDAPFEFEPLQPRRTTPVWDEYIAPYIDQMEIKTSNKSFIDGLACGRLRAVTPESTHIPSVLRSQSRMAKDSLVVLLDGEIYWPTEECLKKIMEIPEEFTFEAVGQTIASEQIGQGVCIKHQSSVVRSIKRHIDAFYGQVKPRKSQHVDAVA